MNWPIYYCNCQKYAVYWQPNFYRKVLVGLIWVLFWMFWIWHFWACIDGVQQPNLVFIVFEHKNRDNWWTLCNHCNVRELRTNPLNWAAWNVNNSVTFIPIYFKRVHYHLAWSVNQKDHTSVGACEDFMRDLNLLIFVNYSSRPNWSANFLKDCDSINVHASRRWGFFDETFVLCSFLALFNFSYLSINRL